MKRRKFVKYGLGGLAALVAMGRGIESLATVEKESTATPAHVVDVHTHWLVTKAFPKALLTGGVKFLDIRLSKGVVTTDGISSVIYDDFFKLGKANKIARQGGVTLRLLSSTMQLSGFMEKTGQSSLEVARRINDTYAGAMEDYPGQVVGMVNVHPFEKDHLRELDRGLDELKLKGVALDSSYNGEFLDDERTYPFWEAVEGRGVGVFIHPPQLPIGSAKMSRYRLEEAVGRPFDSTMCVARMIYSGLFDRFPNLKIHVAHIGGALMAAMGRLDFTYRLGYEGLPEIEAARCQKKPSDYFRTNLWVDTMGFNAPYLRAAIEVFGPDRVLFGSDYGPVPISPQEHIDIVNSLGLAPEDREKIFWKNANELYGLGLSAA